MRQKGKADIQKAVLTTVAVAGLLAVAVVAPNALGLLRHMGKTPHRRQSEVIKAAQKRLVQKGLLIYEDGFVRLTKKGEKKLRSLELKDYVIQKPKRWDRKWRILMFDIGEHRRSTRNQIRTTLQRIGFVHLQHSVWLYPYDCQELVALLKADLKIGKALLYLVVQELEGDRVYREYFHLH